MLVRHLGLQPYLSVWNDMKHFTAARNERTTDELWLLEHLPVYTQGQAGKMEHILQTTSIPIVQSDRGGQITYHGPGQLVAYILVDLSRRQLGIRSLVAQLEQLLIELLAVFNIEGILRAGAPGVYVDNKKIASIGLRVKNNCTYHGIALNVGMDLEPFKNINPCGFARLEMTQISNYIADINVATVARQLCKTFLSHFERLPQRDHSI